MSIHARLRCCRRLLPILLLIAKAQSQESASVLSGDSKAPLQSIGSLSTPLDTGGSKRVTLRGVVTLVRKQVIYVQDQTGALPVSADSLNWFSIGDEVELQGEVHRQGSTVSIAASNVRKLWSGSAPVPVSLTPEQAAEGSFNNWLIDTEGRLLKKDLREGFLRLTIEGNGQLFGAALELSSPIRGSSQLARGLDEGSVVRIVGVCRGAGGAQQFLGSAFVVLLRSTDDIRMISPAPWWNLEHSLWMGCLSLALVSLFYWLRHRALNSRFQAIVEERSRIAREIHDTLAQGFSGLTYQLEGLAEELNASAERSSLERHLGLALQLVRHCREEAHRSIYALRSLAQSDPDLLSLLMSCCESMQEGRDVRLTAVKQGKPVPMPDQMLNQLLRIGQEAITNALRHANAKEIVIALIFDATTVTLKVSDDGDGFDPDAPHVRNVGHFGLLGMQERAKHLRADVEVRSKFGEGTTVSVTAPLRVRAQLKSKFEKIELFIPRERRSGSFRA